MKHDTAIPASRRVYIDFLKVIAIYMVLFNHGRKRLRPVYRPAGDENVLSSDVQRHSD